MESARTTPWGRLGSGQHFRRWSTFDIALLRLPSVVFGSSSCADHRVTCRCVGSPPSSGLVGYPSRRWCRLARNRPLWIAAEALGCSARRGT